VARRRRVTRPIGQRRYRKLYVIVTEGDKTEPIYFGQFDGGDPADYHLHLVRAGTKSAPKHLLRRAQRYVSEQRLQQRDEVWIICDTDQWTEEALLDLVAECRDSGYNLAVSNPCFEYWLLLHSEDAKPANSARDCVQWLRRYLPAFDKSRYDPARLADGIPDAVERARRRDTPPCDGWPRTSGSTGYRLVEKLVGSRRGEHGSKES